MKLNNIKEAIDGAELIGDGRVDVDGIEYDSRRVTARALFVAVTGFKQNGNEFVPEAVANGAAAVMTEKSMSLDVPVIRVPGIRPAMAAAAARFYNYPGNELTVFGVTGTNGKSTSVYLIYRILEAAGHKPGMINSLVYDTGSNRIKAERTTPEAPLIQKYLREMVDSGCTYGVVEVSSHALALNRVDRVDFNVGLYTNFSRDHLDFHRTMEKYLQAKESFLTRLQGDDKSVAINIDVPEFAALANKARCPVVTYSATVDTADVYLNNIELFANKSCFRLHGAGRTTEITFGLPGRYNLNNAVGAAAAAIAEGIDLNDIASGLSSAQPVPGRFEPVDKNQPFAVIIDYAHSPDALIRLCQSARDITTGRLLILFGCGGDRDRGKRPMMGQAATANSDFAVLTADNPRTEDLQQILDDVIPGLIEDRFEIIADRAEAIEKIIDRAEAGDTVLIAGKGAEDYQEIGTEKIPFSDKEEVIAALAKRGYKG